MASSAPRSALSPDLPAIYRPFWSDSISSAAEPPLRATLPYEQIAIERCPAYSRRPITGLFLIAPASRKLDDSHGFRFASHHRCWDIYRMSNREIVIELLSKLPEDAPFQDIAREVEFLAGIQTAREQARRREGIPAEDARKLVDAWAGQ